MCGNRDCGNTKCNSDCKPAQKDTGDTKSPLYTDKNGVCVSLKSLAMSLASTHGRTLKGFSVREDETGELIIVTGLFRQSKAGTCGELCDCTAGSCCSS